MLIALTMLAALQAPPDSLRLEAALALAQSRRPQLTAAAAVVAGARADRRVLGTIPNPVLSYSHTESVPRDHATVDQPLDWLLRRGSDRAAGRALIEGALADSTMLALGVEREVRVAFYGVLAADRVLTLANDEAAIADSLALVADRRLQAGEISELERSQAALEAARVRQTVSGSREAQVIATAALARALALPPDSLPPVAGALDDGLLAAPPALPTLNALPAVQRARADSAAAAAAYRAVQRSRVPLPTIQAGVEWNDPTVLDQQRFAIIGLAFPLPLWHQGGGEAAGAQARAAERAALLGEARGDAVEAVAAATTRLRESRTRALVSRDSILPLAVRQRDLALRAYRAGETGLVPVLEALRAERQIAGDLVQDLLAYQEAHATWIELIGGAL